MSVSRHRKNPKLMGARKSAAKENYDKYLKRAQKKTGVGKDLAAVQERAQYVFDVADTPDAKGRRDTKTMIESLRLELEVLKEVSALHGHTKEVTAGSVTITNSPQFMIAMPRAPQAQIQGETGVVEAEFVEELPGREDVRTLEDEQED